MKSEKWLRDEIARCYISESETTDYLYEALLRYRLRVLIEILED